MKLIHRVTKDGCNFETNLKRLMSHIQKTPGLTAVFFDGNQFHTRSDPRKLDETIKLNRDEIVGCYDYRVETEHLREDLQEVLKKTPVVLFEP